MLFYTEEGQFAAAGDFRKFLFLEKLEKYQYDSNIGWTIIDSINDNKMFVFTGKNAV